jgi:hypothetical protein
MPEIIEKAVILLIIANALIIWLLKKYLFWVENTSNPDYSHIEKN